MIGLRLAGSVCLCAACAVWTFDRRRRLREHISDLDTVCRLISHIRREIEYYSTPLPSIFASFDDPRISNSANAENITTIAEKLELTHDERSKLMSFLTTAGRAFPDAEVRLCSAALEYFTEAYEREKSDFPRRVKAETSIALLVGATGAILII